MRLIYLIYFMTASRIEIHTVRSTMNLDKLEWIEPQKALPEHDEKVVIYVCDDSGYTEIDLCVYDAHKKRFLAHSAHYITIGNEPVSMYQFGDENWPYYEIDQIDLWMSMRFLMPF